MQLTISNLGSGEKDGKDDQRMNWGEKWESELSISIWKNIDNIIDGANSEELSQDDKFENFKKEVKEELKNGISKGVQKFLKLLAKNNGGDDKEEE